MKKYRLKFPYQGHKKGTILYHRRFYDFGLSADDTRLTGIPHTTVTLNSDGDYPGFTIPTGYLEEVDGQNDG